LAFADQADPFDFVFEFEFPPHLPWPHLPLPHLPWFAPVCWLVVTAAVELVGLAGSFASAGRLIPARNPATNAVLINNFIFTTFSFACLSVCPPVQERPSG